MPRVVEVRLGGAAGEYMESARLVAWEVQAGAEVAAGAVLALVETAKATSEVAAPAAGTVAELLVETGSEVPLGAPLCRLLVEGDVAETATEPAPLPPEPPTGSSARSPVEAPNVALPGAPVDGFVPASPLARRLAREHGLDLALLRGSGADGRVVERDVRAALAAGSGSPTTAEGAEALDPQMRAVLDQAARQTADLPPLASWPVEKLRAWMDRRFTPAWSRDLLPLARVEPLAIRGPAGPIACRLYDPGLASPAPALLWLHGGGWIMGGLDSHDGICRRLALAGACRVVAAAYRLAPEYRFPAPLEDAVAVLRFLLEHGAALGLDPARIAVGGDSAGAALALGAMLALRDAGGPRPAMGLLVYGGYRRRLAGASSRRFADPYFLLPPDLVERFWADYLPEGLADGGAPLAEPLLAELDGLPPVVVAAAGCDPLLDQSRALADRLAAAGVRRELVVWPGLVHGCLHMSRAVDAVVVALERLGGRLRSLLAEDRP